MSTEIEIIEVSPRDGIQNEIKILNTETKLELIKRGISAGIRRFEVTSFVNPKRVPQMADAEAVVAGLKKYSTASFIGLTLNKQGFERAKKSGLNEANFVVVATDTFSQKNQGTTTEKSILILQNICKMASKEINIGVTIGAAFGCPFEGEVSLGKLMKVVEKCVEFQPDELSLADTIGVATPVDVTSKVKAVREAYPNLKLRLHLHNTRNTGLANAWAGFESGVKHFDASLGGVGGCPFAPKATGNIPTEDLVYLFSRSGIETNICLDQAIETAKWLEQKLEHPIPGLVMKSGGFPMQ